MYHVALVKTYQKSCPSHRRIYDDKYVEVYWRVRSFRISQSHPALFDHNNHATVETQTGTEIGLLLEMKSWFPVFCFFLWWLVVWPEPELSNKRVEISGAFMHEWLQQPGPCKTFLVAAVHWGIKNDDVSVEFLSFKMLHLGLTRLMMLVAKQGPVDKSLAVESGAFMQPLMMHEWLQQTGPCPF